MICSIILKIFSAVIFDNFPQWIPLHILRSCTIYHFLSFHSCDCHCTYTAPLQRRACPKKIVWRERQTTNTKRVYYICCALLATKRKPAKIPTTVHVDGEFSRNRRRDGTAWAQRKNQSARERCASSSGFWLLLSSLWRGVLIRNEKLWVVVCDVMWCACA